MKKYWFILFSVAVLTGQSKVGTSAAHFLGIGVGARSVSMGGAFTSIASDASALYWNPGAVSRLENSQVLFSSAEWLVETNLNMLAAVLRIDRSRAVGLCFVYLDYGKEEITDFENQDGTGLFWSAHDLSTGLTYAQNLTDRFSVGGTIKYIQQQIHNEKASSAALDLGLLYRTVNEKIQIGMSISNFGQDMMMDGKDLFRRIDLDPDHEGHNETIVAKLKTDPWPLPLFFRVGVSSNIISSSVLRLTLATDAVIPSDDVETVHLGSELAFLDRAFLRAGYKSLGNPDSEEGFTLGVGANVFSSGFSLDVDYTAQDFGMFGIVSHLGLTISF